MKTITVSIYLNNDSHQKCLLSETSLERCRVSTTIGSKQNLSSPLPISVTESCQQNNKCKLSIDAYSRVKLYFI
ncbi:hypothetical protein KPL47_08895 [Clostridium estertheticum]|uniref:hypothetical protein n=1 Tax=Clostridium estertheticum TaxID=238834 RepID=UPI001C0C5D8A|nr:hypothetical protein [Clostridium estertheticum]MBU3176489.1 hypothetical protein [Clostridium estertheticum]